jgi:hypothetical protein
MASCCASAAKNARSRRVNSLALRLGVDVDRPDQALACDERHAHHGAQFEVIDRLAEIERLLAALHDSLDGLSLAEHLAQDAGAIRLAAGDAVALGGPRHAHLDIRRVVAAFAPQEQETALTAGHLDRLVDQVGQELVEVLARADLEHGVQQQLQAAPVHAGVAGQEVHGLGGRIGGLVGAAAAPEGGEDQRSQARSRGGWMTEEASELSIRGSNPQPLPFASPSRKR